MRILIGLTYYAPHLSGLTIYVKRLAEGLAARGHEVTVLTSRHAAELPREETVGGVRIVREPILFHLSKGAIMPGLLMKALKLLKSADVFNLHLPQGDGAILALAGRLSGKPVISTYHCDLQLPEGAFSRVIDFVVYATNLITCFLSHGIVAYTDDYARHSSVLRHFKRKIRVIYPPVEAGVPTPAGTADFKARRGMGSGGPVVGFAARFAEEKGVRYLLKSIPHVIKQFPTVRYCLAGPYQQVRGEKVWQEVQPLIRQYSETVHLLGPIPNEEIHHFFASCDVLTVPSINSTESFGLVQVEAMLSGCPVVVTDLPGVREPVRVTGMGEIVPIRDEARLAAAIINILKDKASYVRPRDEIKERFTLDRNLKSYENLFKELSGAFEPVKSAA